MKQGKSTLFTLKQENLLYFFFTDGKSQQLSKSR